MMKIALQNLGQPNKNGRIYPESVIKDAIINSDSLKNGRLFVTRNSVQYSTQVDMDDVVGMVDDLYIEDKMFGYYDIRPNGIGNVDENGVVSNYELISFSLTNNPA